MTCSLACGAFGSHAAVQLALTIAKEDQTMIQTQLEYLSIKPIQDLRAYACETKGLMAAQCAHAWLIDQHLFGLLLAIF